MFIRFIHGQGVKLIKKEGINFKDVINNEENTEFSLTGTLRPEKQSKFSIYYQHRISHCKIK